MTMAEYDHYNMTKAIDPTLRNPRPFNITPTLRERDDAYIWVLATLGSFHRVIIDHHALQFILQKRYNESFPAVAWRALCYPTSKKSLIKLCVRYTALAEPKIQQALLELQPYASAYKTLVQECRPQSD